MDRFKDIYRIESSRLDGWDYTSNGWYFVTICTKERVECFGEVVDGEMIFNDVGRNAYRMFMVIPKHHKNVKLDKFVIMPNHIHGIIVLGGNHRRLGNGGDGGGKKCRDVACNVSTSNSVNMRKWNSVHMSTISPKSGSLGSVIRSFKSAVTNWCHANGQPNFTWQSRFHDHIIRDVHDLKRIRQYIDQNPVKWNLDDNNPN